MTGIQAKSTWSGVCRRAREPVSGLGDSTGIDDHCSTTSVAWHGPRSPRLKGFSLLELMVVITVIGIMAAMGVPSYRVALRQARADIAAANLRAIWAAERLYWLQYHSYTDKLAHQGATNDGLVDMGMLDPMIFQSRFYTFTCSLATATAFTVTASNTLDAVAMSIDESGAITSDDITLTYQ